jgi:Na+-transporting methylmalonyl-CoA/oxaloacetate decarboxylase gamma subunit
MRLLGILVVEVVLIVLVFVIVGLVVIPRVEPTIAAPTPSTTPAAARGLLKRHTLL